MKHKLLAISSIFVLAATAQTAMANSGTVTFDGAISASTCDVSVNGQGQDGTITLPTVSSSLLKKTGDTTGETYIQFDLRNCVVASTPAYAKVFFNMGDTINTAGRLDIDTTVASPATNVDLQILGMDKRPINLTQDAENQSVLRKEILAGVASMLYGVQYYATSDTGAGVGKVKSSVGYEINYE
jgi:major type 1 subunit fimbrin (pilin)